MNQTFEQLIEDEYKLERRDLCLTCSEYCWLHNPFIWCKRLDYSQETKPHIDTEKTIEQGTTQPSFIKDDKTPDNHSLEIKPLMEGWEPLLYEDKFPDNHSQEVNNSENRKPSFFEYITNPLDTLNNDKLKGDKTK